MVCLLRLVLCFCQRRHGLELISTACRIFSLLWGGSEKTYVVMGTHRCIHAEPMYSCKWKFFSSIDETWCSFSLSLIQMFWSFDEIKLGTNVPVLVWGRHLILSHADRPCSILIVFPDRRRRQRNEGSLGGDSRRPGSED